ncbi:hypothetical protein [Enterococcus mundtii]|uniref:Toxin PIN n=1 Tax=Enterococcus mundtii TaxID=53346 RepID=A0A2M9FUG2_ENTMU|nr:hypothetical protein [Enterococcus mundtii]NMP59654.1 toxin PIN [Enterococcus mundtii]PJK27097.1 toxin PIN [Enterococcus mundtii]UBM05148.1 toxin PIN [Enterococcus mundtii]
MNDRRRRVVKLKKQELNVKKVKVASEYRISTEEAVRFAREVTKALGRMAEDFGNAFASFGKNLQRNMEEAE